MAVCCLTPADDVDDPDGFGYTRKCISNPRQDALLSRVSTAITAPQFRTILHG